VRNIDCGVFHIRTKALPDRPKVWRCTPVHLFSVYRQRRH